MHGACACVHILQCFLKAALFLDLRDNISSEILAGHAGAEFMPFSSRSKGPGLALEPILGCQQPGASGTAGVQQ